ncbi:MAG: hypothetical protein IPL42_02120 [Saprospiraceae bacterium]|nr:hypothetical protein [Saprospiraceae bacterium]
MNNQDLILTSDIRPSDGTVEISRWTPQFTPIFNKRISFTNRDDVHIYYVKQIGTRIYFGGTSKETGIYHSYGFIAALELDGTLAFLKEYEVISNDLYPNTSIVALDSVDENTILAAGYVNDANPIDGNFNSYADGLIVKLDPKDGSVKDYLILSPKKESDYLYFLGIKYQANNKIRISGAQGINQDFLNTGLLYGELDLNFHDIQFNFSKSYSILTRLEKFIDYNHISGRSENFGIFTTHVGSGICNSNVSCFEKAEIISINKELRFVSNRYEFTNLNYTAEDITITRKPIPTTLSAPCGISICSSSQTIPICKQKYIYDYRSIPQIPTAVTNLTPSIAFMTHDKINKKIILDPITSGVALVLFETQLDLFTKQQDTLKFIINNDSLPDLNLGLDKTICQGDSLVLSFGLDSTRWFDGSISKNKTIKTAGKYWGSYFNECGSKSDTILITLEQKPNLMLGADFLICGNLPAQIVSNYDNTIWNTGQSGRSISVTNPGRYVGFVSSACGTSFDTIQVNKFDRSAFDAGLDQKTCDTETLLNANFMNPYPNLYTSKINWKQIDALTAVIFSAIDILNPLITNLTKDQLHSFELSITLNSSCELKDTVHVFSQTCFIDSCAFLIDKICLPNGMIELRALDSNGNLISAKPRQRELLWNIQDGPSKSTYSIFNKNPIVVSNHTIIGLTSKIYSWKKGYPKTIEYADICESKTRDSLNLSCTGPAKTFHLCSLLVMMIMTLI